MAKTKPSWPHVTGPLAEYADGFRAELARLGYTPLTAACQLRLIAHLSRWMTAGRLSARDLDMEAAEQYFATRRSAGYANERTVEALGPLLGYLRALGAAPLPSAEPVTETGQLLDRFGAYLASERGLAPRTVALNVRLARPFLQQRALERDGRLGLDQLTAAEVRAFVLDQARKQPRSAKRIVTALRSLLRFLHVDGVITVPLAGAVPSPAAYSLAGLPRALEPGQVEAMLASCDPATATGRRDRAVLLLLSRLGLRAGEVAALGLDDIDWRRGEIAVRGKGGRRDRLPLPADVGEAIVAYLRDGRPASALDRTVFLAAQAPREALSYTGITTIVRRAAARAGIPGPVPRTGCGTRRPPRCCAAAGRWPRSGRSCATPAWPRPPSTPRSTCGALRAAGPAVAGRRHRMRPDAAAGRAGGLPGDAPRAGLQARDGAAGCWPVRRLPRGRRRQHGHHRAGAGVGDAPGRDARPAWQAQRLGVVRGFARYLHASTRRPRSRPAGLLPPRDPPRRALPLLRRRDQRADGRGRDAARPGCGPPPTRR